MTRSILDAADQERSRRKDDEASAWRTADEAFEELRVTALRVKRERDELLAALKNLIALHPAILNAHCSRPIGAPNSVARIEQEFAATLETEARAAIAKAEGKA